MRNLSDSFMDDLINSNGLLFPILERVKQDDTLMLAIRDGYINIYYRGGNLLKIVETGNDEYKTSFDQNYSKGNRDILPVLPEDLITSQANAENWVINVPQLKEAMDFWFCEHPKPEREYQQLVVRENNFSGTSNTSEYFISDIEVTDSKINARFDMAAIRWEVAKRKNGANCQAAFIEMKYSEAALNGKSGLLKHLQDFDSLFSDKSKYSGMLVTMAAQFNQLDELGLLKFKQCSNSTKVHLKEEDTPQLIFLLANQNPRSSILKGIVMDPKMDQYEETSKFELKFFIANFAGYGLHDHCMISLSQFRKLLKSKNA